MKVQWKLDITKGEGTGNLLIYYYWGKENHVLNRGLCYIEVRYIKVPL